MVGGFVFALDTSIFMAFYSSGFNIMMANGIAMFAGFISGLFLHHYFTFQRSSVLGLTVLVRYGVSLIANYMIATIALKSILYMGSPALMAKLTSTIVAAGTNYLLSRHFVFKTPKNI